MMGLESLSFSEPWLLLALALLPTIRLLLRLTPPAPRQQIFPALRLLFGLPTLEQTPAHTPWWLLFLRLFLALSVILALARPVLWPKAAFPGSGPVILVLDNGWAAAPRWHERQEQALALLDRAERQARTTLILPTAPGDNGKAVELFGPARAADLRSFVQSLTPKPWPTDRGAALAALQRAKLTETAPAIWITDGLDDPAFQPLAKELQQGGGLTLIAPEKRDLPLLLLPPDHIAQSVRVPVQRLATGLAQPVFIQAEAADGRLLARSQTQFSLDQTEATALFALPIELSDAIARFRIEGQDHAGAVTLLDDRFQRKTVGIVSQARLDGAVSLLQDEYYLNRALRPFAQIRQGTVSELMRAAPSTVMLTDDQALTDSDRSALLTFIEKGGALIRFAGSTLAERESSSALLPVRLRHGARQLGARQLGAGLQWDAPQKIASFTAGSPLEGVSIPEDVAVRQQVLAEPDPTLDERIWAKLEDGTPLVTAERRNRGWLVLVHVPASAEWSNLPLSGGFVEMLLRFISLGRQQDPSLPSPRLLAPERILDGFARLIAPSTQASPLPATGLPPASPIHPPGYYGDDRLRRALNLIVKPKDLNAISNLPSGIESRSLTVEREISLTPWLWLAACSLFLIDFALSIAIRRNGYRLIGSLALAMLSVCGAHQAKASNAQEFALEASRDTRLAAIVTGNAELDRVSLLGLRELSRILSERTAVEPLEPMAVDIERDELTFFPLLYWPLDEQQAPLSRQATDKLNRYLHRAGIVLFDSRDGHSQAFSLTGLGKNAEILRRLTQGIEIPPLIPLARDHVLNRSFYLLSAVPGRFTEGTLWLQATKTDADDVASVLLGANDYASAWAGDRLSGITPHQREQALRFGVNLVIYALTGNYKADQVHIPAILERLGQ